MENSLGFLDGARRQLDGSDHDIELWGPLPAVIARRADRFRAQLVLLAHSRGRLNQVLSNLCQQLDNQRQPKGLRWQVDVDPQETA